LFSPWTDLTCSLPAYAENIARCAWFMPEQVAFVADTYVAGRKKDDPLVSPIYGDLSGLPPLLLHASDSELLRDDSVQLAERARARGVTVQLRLWHGLPHAWPNFAGLMPEADLCLAESADAILHLSATARAAAPQGADSDSAHSGHFRGPSLQEKELRLALVCFGGVSLAIYMHGVTKEILKLVRASQAYHALPKGAARDQAKF